MQERHSLRDPPRARDAVGDPAEGAQRDVHERMGEALAVLPRLRHYIYPIYACAWAGLRMPAVHPDTRRTQLSTHRSHLGIGLRKPGAHMWEPGGRSPVPPWILEFRI